MARGQLLWEAAKPSPRTFRRWLLTIGLAAFVLRVLYMLTIAPPLPPIADESFYYYASNLIARGHGYSQPFVEAFFNHLVPTALHPPLWPALLAVVSVFTAPTSGVGSLVGTAADLHRAVGCLCGAVVVVLVGLLGRRIGDWRVGLLAAALAAFYPHFITLDGDLVSESLYGVLVGGLLIVSYDFATRPTRARAVALGALVGLAALTREEALLFIPVLLIPLAWDAGPARLRLGGLALLGVLLVIVPWTARNYVAFDQFVPVANSGAVVAGANCWSTYYGSNIGSWQGSCAAVPHQTPESPEAVISSRQRDQGVNYASRHLGRAILVAGVRLLRVWSLYGQNYQTIGNTTLLGIGLPIYYVLLVAAGYALVSLVRRGRRILILVAPVIVTSLASLLGDGLDRLRYDAELPLIALAAWSFVLLFTHASRLQPDTGRARRAAISPRP